MQLFTRQMMCMKITVWKCFKERTDGMLKIMSQSINAWYSWNWTSGKECNLLHQRWRMLSSKEVWFYKKNLFVCFQTVLYTWRNPQTSHNIITSALICSTLESASSTRQRTAAVRIGSDICLLVMHTNWRRQSAAAVTCIKITRRLGFAGCPAPLPQIA